jgi:hypothetical protein
MNRKLLLLNLLLIAAVVWAVYALRRDWRSSRQREEAKLNRPIRQLPPPRVSPLPLEQPVLPSGYAAIAQKDLFDRSRNPDVPIEPPPPPPPKPPMPALPVFHGLMNIGADGPTAILSINTTAPHKAVHPGEPIGQFKLLSVNSSEVVLEWNGETIRKTPEELANRQPVTVQQDSGPRTEAPAQAAAPPPPQATGPGETTNFGFRMCSLSDGHAEGDVVDGYRKVVHNGPFGKSCTYDPVK